MKTFTADELQQILTAHVAYLKNEVNGVRADLAGADLREHAVALRGADLSGAYLSRANLRGANLYGANLSDADLGYANLRGADLRYADLRGANLGDADLRYADLRYADLRGANLSEAIMPGSYTFEVYKSEVVPALLTAGGKTLEEVVGASWACHSWTNCPMAVAFDVNGIDEIPPLHRENARLFVQLFDAGLIPNPLGEQAAA
jgi:uncharacterized protein YjbI with pentapeptide repeats